MSVSMTTRSTLRVSPLGQGPWLTVLSKLPRVIHGFVQDGSVVLEESDRARRLLGVGIHQDDQLDRPKRHALREPDRAIRPYVYGELHCGVLYHAPQL